MSTVQATGMSEMEIKKMVDKKKITRVSK